MCGKDAVEGEFVLPMYEDWNLTAQGKVVGKIHLGIKPHNANLCQEHAELIAKWIDAFNKS